MTSMTPRLPERSVRQGVAAVLFDMDGLLIDSEPVWTVAEKELARRLGGVWSPALKAQIVGTRLDVAVPTILSWYGVPGGPSEVLAATDWLLGRMVELFTEGLIALPGATDLLAVLRAEQIPVALVSSSYRVLVDAVLAHGFGPFTTTVAGDEVVRAKPDPEPYLTAAARLEVDPRRCVVLEDSPAGGASGEAAGCAVVAVPSVAGVTFSAGRRRMVRTSLAQLDRSALDALVG